ncbi:glycosyltransferase family 2 protein [Dissulfurirhabdus thermomarina]|nr:glycosyltransferase family 2 protein [Dissulfurirhabdus thermomarina]NMX23760.1 glycosyltransferase family 2 protein [Dissulfurirhabdus thermomarina]
MRRPCVVVPAYNAEATLGPLLERLLPLAGRVAVVDDGSADGTARVAAAFAPRGVELLCHPRNRGKGAALRTGFRWAMAQGCRAVVTLDSDLQHAPEDLPALLAAFDETGADVLVGSRVHERDRMPGARRFGNWISSWFAGRFCHRPVPDSQCGFRIYRLPECAGLLADLRADRFDAETEVLLKAAVRGLRIAFAPITVIYPEGGRHRSHYRAWVDTLRIIRLYFLELCRRTFTPRGRRDVRELRRHGPGGCHGSGYRLLPREW